MDVVYKKAFDSLVIRFSFVLADYKRARLAACDSSYLATFLGNALLYLWINEIVWRFCVNYDVMATDVIYDIDVSQKSCRIILTSVTFSCANHSQESSI